MRTCAFVAGLVLLLGSGVVRASGSPEYDLAACIRAALTNSPDLGAAAADLAGARARLGEAKAGRWGQSEYNQLLGFVNEAQGDPTCSPNNKNDIFKGLGPFTRLELNINIPLWTFGKLDSALEGGSRRLGERARAHRRQACGGDLVHQAVVLRPPARTATLRDLARYARHHGQGRQEDTGAPGCRF